ncbi:glycoside hydrolase superfamily [Apodospora peruviana]|uniref:Glycoside hydrolase superfamily n=1 Tax=Apodospora peruviana TaxID=516989 RepID=A0AAE0HT93_9PEZI|nr:glycoside hydrolase superfamily [Apodospora peruviana]
MTALVNRLAATAHAGVLLFGLLLLLVQAADALWDDAASGRERISLNKGWHFKRWESNPDNIVLKPWILPMANAFINDPATHFKTPVDRQPGFRISFAGDSYNDTDWEAVDLPHDWAIKGPFYTADTPVVGGGMGRLPIHGIAWYRRKLTIGPEDEDRRIYLDIDGAMSYSMVWINGNLAGGWPFGYNSFRVDLTPYLKLNSSDNQLAIRLDNPVQSSRWYPGGGLYRNVWLVKVDDTHIAQWGTLVTTEGATAEAATVQLSVQVENSGNSSREVMVATDIYELADVKAGMRGMKVASLGSKLVSVLPGQRQTVNTSAKVEKPKLWGPPPTQTPNLHVAVTRLILASSNKTIDTYETRFGIRTLNATGERGLLVNGERIYLQGVNQHHDLGALGAAFNHRAAERQLEVLRELGANAIRMSHNPPAPELLDLADEMGFLVMNEAFDCWQNQKNPNDFHLIFDDWSEADLRAMMRRDRNHPSIFAWSTGNEVGEQTDGANGGSIGRRLSAIVHEEDPSHRGSTASMNVAKPNTPFTEAFDIMSLNYQGEGIRDTPAYSGFTGTHTPPLYPDFHKAFPNSLLLSSETAAALSTRGTYFFPVTNESSAPQTDQIPAGGSDPKLRQVSAYELYSTPFGASPDKVFAKQDENQPYVAGEFVWTGWDYLGEPTPYYSARSSYFGIVDLCGFKKDRFHLYQARWRPDLKTAHILPHWNWPDRKGEVTPVHVFTAADEAELFLNGKTLGTLKKASNVTSYRFRWDDVRYEPGELRVVTFKDGKEWANDTVLTTGAPAALRLTADRSLIKADGHDLSFLTVEVVDKDGLVVPDASNAITFTVVTVVGGYDMGEIAATDNGDPYDMVAFPSKTRKAFSGKALAIMRAKPGAGGLVTVVATAEGLTRGIVALTAVP